VKIRHLKEGEKKGKGGGKGELIMRRVPERKKRTPETRVREGESLEKKGPLHSVEQGGGEGGGSRLLKGGKELRQARKKKGDR